MEFKFKVEMKLCPKCHLPAYSTTFNLTGKTLYYCQNMFCMNLGKGIS